MKSCTHIATRQLIAILITLVALHASRLPAADRQSTLLFDFEASDLAQTWSAMGDTKASRVPVQPATPAATQGPSGHCMEVAVEKAGRLYTKPGKVPEDWRGFEAVAFNLFRPPEESGKPLRIEVQALDQDGKGLLWRKAEIPASGWMRIAMPLRFFGPGEDRLLSWTGIRRLGFSFSEPCTVRIDNIVLEKADGGPSALLSTEDLLKLAFPDPAAAGATVLTNGGVRLLSGAKDVDVAPLLEDMLDVQRTLEGWLPFMPAPDMPPTLIVFPDRDAYRAFTPRLAAAYKRVAEPPTSDGYTLLGYSTGAWDPAQGLKRPTFLHEFVHSLIERRLLLPNRSEWFQEGVANAIQARYRPQANLSDMIAKGITEDSWQRPLSELCNGKPIEIRHYWQALTLIELLLEKPAYKTKLKDLVDAFRAAGSTDLGPHLGPVLGTDWEKLTVEWKDFCRKRYTGTGTGF